MKCATHDHELAYACQRCGVTLCLECKPVYYKNQIYCHACINIIDQEAGAKEARKKLKKNIQAISAAVLGIFCLIGVWYYFNSYDVLKPSAGCHGTVLRYYFKFKTPHPKTQNGSVILQNFVKEDDFKLVWNDDQKEIIQQVPVYFGDLNKRSLFYINTFVPGGLQTDEVTVSLKLNQKVISSGRFKITAAPVKPSIEFINPDEFQKLSSPWFSIKVIGWIKDSSKIVFMQKGKTSESRLQYSLVTMTNKFDFSIPVPVSDFEPGDIDVVVIGTKGDTEAASNPYTIKMIQPKPPKLVELMRKNDRMAFAVFNGSAKYLKIYIDDREQKINPNIVEASDPQTGRQKYLTVNFIIPAEFQKGNHAIKVKVGDLFSNEKNFDEQTGYKTVK
ncbi:MAG: hypothetical protein JW774_09655 [Candidatus Aureabacteria bacterium]|nr:hypothetical protein [Candidatus Auribacterota bacterium]